MHRSNCTETNALAVQLSDRLPFRQGDYLSKQHSNHLEPRTLSDRTAVIFLFSVYFISLLLDECQEVLQHCAAVEAAEDDVLIAQSERDPSMYIVLKGQVSVYCDHKIFGVGHGAGGDPLGATNIAAFGGGDAND